METKQFDVVVMFPFNRTVVELKSGNTAQSVSLGTTFNRTVVELKCTITVVSICGRNPFNRTVVELK